MCRVCQEAKCQTRDETLASIARAIQRGAKAEHFDKVTDELLGTSMLKRDAAAERAYEERRRAGGDEPPAAPPGNPRVETQAMFRKLRRA